MAEITVSNLRHSYDGDLSDPARLALKGIDHVWRDGGAYALLGPSGCGKSSMLNIISGLVRPTAGRVLFDGRDVTELGPEQRNIAQVFQFPVLYDTMTVEQNLAFPLRNRRVDPGRITRRVREVAEMLDLGPMLGRRAAGLGAAEKQKISLGRGLVREDVAAILFDEPLTVIDPQVKFDLRRKLRLVHETLGLTLVYVTHDQSEALTFADQVVVMSEGEVVQVGTPEELYERPGHTFVGHFIGSPGMNFLPCALEGGRIVFDGGSLPAPRGLAARPGGALVLGIRPHGLGPATDEAEAVPARLIDVEDRGAFRIAEIAIGGNRLRMRVGERDWLPADGLRVAFRPEATLLYANDRLLEDAHA
ncbi:ABC transporter ATP-binding protein [Amaricoccus solimangrovi]|uniref:ABC transporter ATP-binding protein n=1 Tax=Amaricoccus solimangrovi TaxID=2589815 RepID=A0A501WF32_9RHOB|nr:ABC transporter ATP-binding protein [Amaricoccus solimangrovi]TPE46960.1 ABC transporter ATP-binding protein [Amaricoccus solimangrovi]